MIWQGLHGSLTFPANGRRFSGAFSIPGWRLARKDGTLALHDMLLRADVHLGDGAFTLTDMLVEIGRGAFTSNAADPVWAMQGWTMRGTATVAAETVDTTAAMHLDSLRVAGERYGPGTLTFDVRRLHMASCAAFLQAFFQLKQQDMPQALFGVLLLSKLLEVVPALLEPSPQMALTHVYLHTAAGEIRGQATIHFDGSRLPSPNPLLMFLHALEAAAECRAPATIVHQIAALQMRQHLRASTPAHLDALATVLGARQIQTLVERRILVPDGTHYVIHARYAQGQLLVNGMPVDLP
jgi:uncharacterized protein YdgA (DUF945 family)